MADRDITQVVKGKVIYLLGCCCWCRPFTPSWRTAVWRRSLGIS
ncbi:MAG: hypothetical protein WBO48_15865 [Candidatus Promineifilaceae bacterium]